MMMMKPQNSFHLSRSLPEQEKIFKDLLYNLQLIHRKSLTRSSKTRKRRVTTRMEETALSVEDFCLSMTTERRHPRTLASAQRVAPEEEIQAPNDKELMVPRKRVRKTLALHTPTDFHKGVVPTTTYSSMYRPRLPSLRSGLLRKGSLSPHQHPNSETVEDVLMEEKESVALHHHRIHQAPPPLQQETRTSQMKIRQPLKDVSALDPNADALLKNIIQNQKIPAPIKRSMLGKKPKARNQDVITKDSETLSPPTKKATNSSAADALKKHELMQKQIQEVKRERARKAAEQAKARKLEEESKRARLSQLDSYCKSQRKIQLERLAQKKIAEQAPRIAVEKCQNEPDSTAVPHVTLVHDPTFESLPDNAPDFSTGPVIIPVTNTLETVQERQLISLDENSSIEMIIEPPAKKAEIDSADLLKALRDVRQKSRSDLNKPNLDFERMTRAAQRAEWLRSRFEALAASRNSDLDTDYTDVSTTADGLTHFTENVSILSDAQVPMERPEVLSLALQESHTAVPPSLEAPVFEDKGADVIPLTDHQTKEDTSEWDMIMEITPAQDSIPAPVGVPKDDVSYTSAVDDSEVPGNFEDLQTKECSQTGLIIEIEKSNMESLEVIIVDDPLKASIGVGSIHGFDRRLKELVLKQKAASKIQKWFKRAISVKKSDAWRNHPDKDAVCSRLTRVLFQPDRVLKESNAVEMDMFTQTHPQKDSTSLKRDSSYLVLPKNEKFGLLVPQKDEFCVMKIFERNFVAGRDVPTPSEKGSIQDLMDVSESELKSEKKHNGVPRKSHSEKDEKRATAIFKPLFPATSQLPVKLDDHALGVEEISDNSFVSDGPSADSSIMSELADSCKKDLERPAVPYSPSDTPDLSEGSLSATENVVGILGTTFRPDTKKRLMHPKRRLSPHSIGKKFDASNDLLAGIENSIQDVNLMQKNIDMAKLQTGLSDVLLNKRAQDNSELEKARAQRQEVALQENSFYYEKDSFESISDFRSNVSDPVEQVKAFSTQRDDSILEDDSDCSLQNLALKIKEASKVAIQHDDNRYSNIKKLVSSALEVQTVNLAKAKAEDAKVLKMVEQVLALVAPNENIKPITSSKSKSVGKENKPREVDSDSIEEDIMADSESQSLILEKNYDDESFESISGDPDLADQSVSILREDSVDDQINQVVLNLKALQDAIQDKRQKVSKVEKTKKRIYLEKMKRKEEELKQRFLRLDQILKESELFIQDQPDVSFKEDACLSVPSPSRVDGPAHFGGKPTLDKTTDHEIEELIVEEDYTVEPSVDSNSQDRSLALTDYSEIPLKQHVITPPSLVQNGREQDLSQNVPAQKQYVSTAAVVSQSHEGQEISQITESLPKDLVEAAMGLKPTRMSLEPAAEVFSPEEAHEPFEEIVEDTLSEPMEEITVPYIAQDEALTSVDVVHGQALDAAVSVDLVTDIIFGELLKEIDLCSTIVTSQPDAHSLELEEAYNENLEVEIDEPGSYHELPLNQEDTKSILREWISAFVPDSNDGFTRKPIIQESLLLHTVQNLPEQSPRFEEICLLFDTADEIMSAIFLPFEVKKEREACAPYLSLSPLSKETLLSQITAKILETWEYVEVHDQNLDECLIQNVKVDEKGWANLSHSTQTEIINQVTNALFEELLQDTSRISAAMTGSLVI